MEFSKHSKMHTPLQTNPLITAISFSYFKDFSVINSGLIGMLWNLVFKVQTV